MKRTVIEKKIKEKLDEYGFMESDLTQAELEELKDEVEAELKGYTVLDGVLFHIPYYERIAKRGKKKHENISRSTCLARHRPKDILLEGMTLPETS